MSSFTGKARRSALHTSSPASFFQTSGPLHNGHTRISRSFGSIGSGAGLGYAGKEEVFEFARELGLHAQVPHARVGECGAFYGILLGHDDDLGARQPQLARLVV